MAAEGDQLKALLTTFRERQETFTRHAKDSHTRRRNPVDAQLAAACAEDWRLASEELEAALLALGERQETAEPAQDLHQRMMNIPCDVNSCEDTSQSSRRAYKLGHRDARHAAAELALAAHREGPATADNSGLITRLMSFVEHRGNCPLDSGGTCHCGAVGIIEEAKRLVQGSVA